MFGKRYPVSNLGRPKDWGLDQLGTPVIGGRIMVRRDVIEFYMDRDVRDAIENRTGMRPPWPLETQIGHCNPLPGIVPALGEFTDPVTGDVCWLDLPEGWGMAYLDYLLETR